MREKSSLESLSMRYCDLDDACVAALIDLVEANDSLEMLYLHFSKIDDHRRVLLTAAWQRRGHLHRVEHQGVDSLTLMRKTDLAFLADRKRLVPAWARGPPPKTAHKKGPKKKGTKKKKK